VGWRHTALTRKDVPPRRNWTATANVGLSIALATAHPTAPMVTTIASGAQNISADDLARRSIERRAVEAVNWGMAAVNYDLMKKLLANNLSMFEPDPLAAIAEAEWRQTAK
jgi:hypothetical protein